MRVGYFSPSYGRPEKSVTQKAYPFIKLVVAESEAEAYRVNGNEVVVCPDAIQGNVARVRNWILEQYLPEYDCVIMMDDDISHIGAWREQKRKVVDASELPEFCELHAIMCKDAGLFLWGMNYRIHDKSLYRENMPFNFISPILGPFSGHMHGTAIRYDESLPLKEDYDLSLQHLHKYGGILRVNYASYQGKRSEQPGGCATYRNIEREKEQFNLLQEKWGSAIVTLDKKSKRSYDYNPVLRIPLRGV